jgi:membrane protein YfhO
MQISDKLKKNFVQNLSVMILFLVIGYLFASPVLSGKKLYQPDILQGEGMKNEVQKFRDQYGEEPLWTNSMFGGMPATFISTYYKANINEFWLYKVLKLIPSPVKYIFILCLGMFVLLRGAGLNIWLSAIGAIVWSLMSTFLIPLEAGHNTKILTTGFSTGALGAMLMAFKGKWLQGGLLMIIFSGMMFQSGHLQITYYFLIIGFLLTVFQLVNAIMEKRLNQFLKALGILAIGGIIGFLPNTAKVWSQYEHGKETMRGGASELAKKENKAGLEIGYAFRWSLDKDEILTTVVPYYMGGGSAEKLGENSNVGKALKRLNVQPGQKQQILNYVPLYYGSQSSTSGPNYFGATVIFLFILSLFLIKGPLKYWALLGIVLSFMMSWGSHFMGFNEFLFNNLPMYNKFRTPSVAINIAAILLPFLGFIGLGYFIENKQSDEKIKKYFKYAVMVTGGLFLILAVIGFTSDFAKSVDQEKLGSSFWMSQSELYDALVADRRHLFLMDVLRSFVLVGLVAGSLYLFMVGKIKKKNILYAVIGLIMVFDVWAVSKRYLNDDDFVSKSQYANLHRPTSADQQIMKDPDPDFRVLNIAVNTFNDASTSYYHKSVGGYHPAKLQRYQDMIDHHIAYRHLPVLNMLNTKYFILKNKQGDIVPSPNRQAMGNAWFVPKIKWVPDADREIMYLDQVYVVEDMTNSNSLIVHGNRTNRDTVGTYGTFSIQTNEGDVEVDLRTRFLVPGKTVLVGSADSCDIKIERPGVAPVHAKLTNIFVFDPASEAIIDKWFKPYLDTIGDFAPRAGDEIKLESYKPNHLIYSSKTSGKRLAVFSEIYYKNGWKAFVDDKEVDYIRVNYILRGMIVPKGDHTIVFKFEPRTFYTGSKISLAGSGIYLIAVLGLLYLLYFRKPDEETEQA